MASAFTRVVTTVAAVVGGIVGVAIAAVQHTASNLHVLPRVVSHIDPSEAIRTDVHVIKTASAMMVTKLVAPRRLSLQLSLLLLLLFRLLSRLCV
jgi:hypothetical protein